MTNGREIGLIAPAFARADKIGDDRLRQRDQPAAAHPLQRAGGGEQEDVGAKSAGGEADDKYGDADHQHDATAVDVGELAVKRRDDGRRDQIGGDDPGRRLQIAEFDANRRQRGDDDGRSSADSSMARHRPAMTRNSSAFSKGTSAFIKMGVQQERRRDCAIRRLVLPRSRQKRQKNLRVSRLDPFSAASLGKPRASAVSASSLAIRRGGARRARASASRAAKSSRSRRSCVYRQRANADLLAMGRVPPARGRRRFLWLRGLPNRRLLPRARHPAQRGGLQAH